MEKRRTIVIVDVDCSIVYSSFYLHGLYALLGKRNVRFGKIAGKPSQSGYMSFVVCQEGKPERKITISLVDSYKVNEALYDWCDVYGSVNANYAKTPEGYREKLVALCPSFGIRQGALPRELAYALLGRVEGDAPLKKRLGKALSVLRRPTYEAYYPSTVSDHFVFFLSTLWFNDEWNKNDEGVNARRANFIRACKDLKAVCFEGGLVSQGKERSSEALFADCLCDGMPMNEWMEKTKRSVLVFNTPAFWDCHGWKLGEYLAMGKCIVSTKLSNDLPAPLEHGKNIHFVENNQEAMKEAIKYIIDHPGYRAKLEQGARTYWETYGTPVASLKLLGIE